MYAKLRIRAVAARRERAGTGPAVPLTAPLVIAALILAAQVSPSHGQSGVYINQGAIDRLSETPSLAPLTNGQPRAATEVLLFPPATAPQSQLVSQEAISLLRAELEAEQAANPGQRRYSAVLLGSLGLGPAPGLQITPTPELPQIASAPEATDLVDPNATIQPGSTPPPSPEAASTPAQPSAETPPSAGPVETAATNSDNRSLEAQSGDQSTTDQGKTKKNTNKTDKKQQKEQVAAVPKEQKNEQTTSVAFAADSTELSVKDKEVLTELAQRLNDNSEVRLQLLAYANDDGEGAQTARRLSLSRALVVRRFLVEQGVSASRVQVRALGNQAIDGVPDRVDILPLGG